MRYLWKAYMLRFPMIPHWHSGYHSSSNDKQSKIAIECLISTPSSTFGRQLKHRIHGVWRQMRYQWKADMLRFPMIPHWHSGYHSSSNDRQSKIAIECLISTPSGTSLLWGNLNIEYMESGDEWGKNGTRTFCAFQWYLIAILATTRHRMTGNQNSYQIMPN